MLESIVFVVRRVYWEAQDESHQEYLTTARPLPKLPASALPLSPWTRYSPNAWPFETADVFDKAVEMGGGVFLRMPSGREVAVSKTDFFPENKSK